MFPPRPRGLRVLSPPIGRARHQPVLELGVARRDEPRHPLQRRNRQAILDPRRKADWGDRRPCPGSPSTSATLLIVSFLAQLRRKIVSCEPISKRSSILIANKTGIVIPCRPCCRKPIRRRNSAWLDALNPEQRRAATHGGARRPAGRCSSSPAPAPARPARSPIASPTSSSPAPTPPHPAADLLPPRRRRDGPAGRADRRRGACRRPAARRCPGRAPSTPSARGCLREYAPAIGLAPAFTILDREDSADLMNLVRHELGLSKTESRFPHKGTCLRSTRAPSMPRRRSARS